MLCYLYYMAGETKFLKQENDELKMKQIIGASIFTLLGAIISLITVWTFLESKFAPKELTNYKLQIITESHEVYSDEFETKMEKLESDVRQLEKYFEKLQERMPKQ